MGDAIIALLTLTLMEIVLGVDNIIFIAILCGKLPKEKQGRVRTIGLILALVMRLGLLSCISWLMRLTTPLFGIAGREISGRDLILLIGGLFLVAKATHELHDKLETDKEATGSAGAKAVKAGSVLFQIILLDIVFSLDSVITAVGMASDLWVMMVAVVLAVGVMLFAAGGIARFVERHPTVKVLALSFLLLIGVTLVADGWGEHIPKGYVYFAMAFSLFVEFINLRVHAKSKPIQLHSEFTKEELTKV